MRGATAAGGAESLVHAYYHLHKEHKQAAPESTTRRHVEVFTYAAEPGSRSAEGLKLLGSWAATVDSAESTHATNQS
jgi:hypothetical protein